MLYPAVLLSWGPGVRAVQPSGRSAFRSLARDTVIGVTCKCKCEHLNEATRQERPAKTEPCLRREGRRDSVADKIRTI